jgi:hypothetical protein
MLIIRFLLEMPRVKKDTNLTTYTKQDVEARISSMYASWFGNQSKNILQMFEDNYLKTGVADDDHLAWLQFAVDVRNFIDETELVAHEEIV